MHELGHGYYCPQDEYWNNSAQNTQCGHSVMASHGQEFNHNMCTDFDHKKDRNPDPSIPDTTLPSAHRQAWLAGRNITWINQSYDNYNYSYFDFNGIVAKVVLK